MKNLEKILEEIKDMLEDNKVIELNSDGTLNKCVIDVKLAWNGINDIICEHMTDGWIPVEERLPEEGQEVWISVKTDYVRRGMYTKCFGFGMREGFICSDGFVDINAVNAWKLYIMPEPYCPEAKAPERKQEWKERMLQNFMKKGEK